MKTTTTATIALLLTAATSCCAAATEQYNSLLNDETSESVKQTPTLRQRVSNVEWSALRPTAMKAEGYKSNADKVFGLIIWLSLIHSIYAVVMYLKPADESFVGKAVNKWYEDTFADKSSKVTAKRVIGGISAMTAVCVAAYFGWKYRAKLKVW